MKTIFTIVLLFGILFGGFVVFENVKRDNEILVYKEKEYQEFLIKDAKEKKLKDDIWGGCAEVIRAKADAATLQIGWDYGGDYIPTEGGWKIDLKAEDSTGAIRISCYTDKNGRFIRMVAK